MAKWPKGKCCRVCGGVEGYTADTCSGGGYCGHCSAMFADVRLWAVPLSDDEVIPLTALEHRAEEWAKVADETGDPEDEGNDMPVNVPPSDPLDGPLTASPDGTPAGCHGLYDNMRDTAATSLANLNTQLKETRERKRAGKGAARIPDDLRPLLSSKEYVDEEA